MNQIIFFVISRAINNIHVQIPFIDSRLTQCTTVRTRSITIIRGHSRNRPKGGRNSPNVTSHHVLLTILLNFYSRRVQKPLQGALSAVFCTKFRQIHRIRLVRRHRITNFLSKNLFAQVDHLCLIEVRAMAVAVQQPSAKCTAIFTMCIV